MAGRTKDQGAGNEQQPYMPGEAARRRGEIPTGETRNKDYGKGRQSGVVADKSERDKSEHEKEQEAELEMNERNH